MSGKGLYVEGRHLQVGDSLVCLCGYEARTQARIARHLQKWNYARLRYFRVVPDSGTRS